MRTSMNIPEELLKEAKRVSNSATKTQVVILALEEFIQRRNVRKLADLKGTLKEEVPYKKLRSKKR